MRISGIIRTTPTENREAPETKLYSISKPYNDIDSIIPDRQRDDSVPDINAVSATLSFHKKMKSEDSNYGDGDDNSSTPLLVMKKPSAPPMNMLLDEDVLLPTIRSSGTQELTPFERRQSQLLQLQTQFSLMFGAKEAERMALETIGEIKKTESHAQDRIVLQNISETQELEIEDSITNAFLNHSRRESTFLSLQNDFRRVFHDEVRGTEYAFQVMEKFDTDPKQLFQKDEILQRILTRRYVHDIVDATSKQYVIEKFKNNQNPTRFSRNEVLQIATSTAECLMSHKAFSDKSTNLAKNIQLEELEMLKKEFNEVKGVIQEKDIEILRLKQEVEHIVQTKCHNAIETNRTLDFMRNTLRSYSKIFARVR